MAIIRFLILGFLLTSFISAQGIKTYQKTVPVKSGTINNFLNAKVITDTTISGDTLRQNEEWSGNITVTGEIVVPDSIILTIDRGANIYFSNNTSLKAINGLITTDNYFSPEIIFRYNDTLENRGYLIGEGHKNGNIFNGIRIIKGGGIQILNGAYGSINSSILDSCWDGIYFYNATTITMSYDSIIEPQQNGIFGEGSYLTSMGDVIIKTSSNGNYQNYQGIFLNTTSAGVSYDDIRGFCWGVYVGSWSDMWADDPSIYYAAINNKFIDNEVGIGAGWGGFIWEESDDGGFNRIFNNTDYDVFCYEGSTALVGLNYWGGGPLSKYYCDSTSYIESDDYLEGEASPSNRDIRNTFKSNFGHSQFDFKLLEKQEIVNAETKYYQSLVKEEKNSAFALSQLYRINRENPSTTLSEYFETLLKTNNKNTALIQKIVADDNIRKNKFEEAITGYDKLIADNPNDFYGIDARFEKLFAYLHVKHDTLKATELLSEIKALDSKDIEVGMRTKIAENLLYKYNRSLTDKTKEIPSDYRLSQNYPNPFNPATRINYQIPKSGVVSLKVYDILGREVANLVNEYKNEGMYDVTFNASKLASGVYIYQLRANDYVASKKMILIK
ncbi:MAG: T9SS type A sorting domain-containing protein [Ignavibacteriaceae bacterium]|nr:T9SS type A sorting domain-containing protein [Ignavibacteriaceae bacterium]